MMLTTIVSRIIIAARLLILNLSLTYLTIGLIKYVSKYANKNGKKRGNRYLNEKYAIAVTNTNFK